MPPTANIVSGKTSLLISPARIAAASCGEPGTAAPIGVKASAPSPPKRSAMVRTPRIDMSRMVPCRNSAGPSMTTARSRVMPWDPVETVTSTTSAAAREATATVTCAG